MQKQYGGLKKLEEFTKYDLGCTIGFRSKCLYALKNQAS